MAKDPICGMDVKEKNAPHLLHFERETFYFCSEQRKETYAQQAGLAKPATPKGVFTRFLEKLTKGNAQDYGGRPHKCH